MCGRYTVAGDTTGFRQRFGLDERLEVRQRFNVAPGDDVVAVTPGGGTLLRWGFLRDSAYTTINARAETLMDKPTWRSALQDGRCLIVADGFYEWRGRQGYWITRADHAPFAFAGLASPAGTCAIVTTAAAPEIADLHDRMPVILPPDRESAWLDPRTSTLDATDLLVGFRATAHMAVGPAVNDARHDAPDCLEPAPPALF